MTSIPLGDMQAVYSTGESGHVCLVLVPLDRAGDVVEHRQTLAAESWARGDGGPAMPVGTLVPVKLAGDAAAGYGQGRTMRYSPSEEAFRLAGQQVETEGDTMRVVTTLRDDAGHTLRHVLEHVDGAAWLTSHAEFVNESAEPVVVEMLASFCLSGITPYAADDAPERLVAHRFRTSWSSEGRLCSEPIEALHLEPSYSHNGVVAERFGQVGTMPTRGWFPTAGVTDTEAGVTWAASLAWAGSWQMEFYRHHDDLSLAGGLADFEFGHWRHTVAPGDTLLTPTATLTVTAGGIDEACDRLVAAQLPAALAGPAIERDLPVVFNEWCTSWGSPTHDSLRGNVAALAGTGIGYVVIDAGWFRPADEAVTWYTAHGDWVVNARQFPYGISATAEAIRQAGYTPGIWFEIETVGRDSEAWHLTDHLLRRDGVPVTSGGRRFWDFSDPWVHDYLTERVTGLLAGAGFGYLKIDDNQTLGLGADHPDGWGEGLRQQTYGWYGFLDGLRAAVPDLVIENCASGGHRLEASMLARTQMSSFSDAHEPLEIPIIAAALHRLLLPRQSQIWAVLRADDSAQRATYTLAAGFLGRLCISGDIGDLPTENHALMLQACERYREAAPVIADGVSRLFGDVGPSWRHPRGWQALRRVNRAGDRALVVTHTFSGSPDSVRVPVGDGWRVASAFGAGPDDRMVGSELAVAGLTEFEARVHLLER